MTNKQHDQMYNAMMQNVSQQHRDIFDDEQRRSREALGIEESPKNVTEKKEESAFDTFLRLSRSKKESHEENHVTPMMTRNTLSPLPAPPEHHSYSDTTSAGTDDGHTHKAFYDEMGNGETDGGNSKDGHTHVVRSFMVAPYQSTDGMTFHNHPGRLVVPQRTPGSEYKDYTGEMK